MRPFRRIILTVIAPLIGYFATHAQAGSKYNPFETFAPNFYPAAGNDIRTSDGRPGIHYWQNRADYSIDSYLDEAKEWIYGTVTINYTNNSPSDLPSVWLQLDQNKFSNQLNKSKMDSGGYRIHKVALVNEDREVPLVYEVYGTRMRIDLLTPLKAKGGRLELKIKYSFPILESPPRHGIAETPDGNIYQVAQWYPRMCVYDDIAGWNTLPYRSGEFYLEYGDYRFSINVPASHIVVASGILLNPKEVLTPLQLARLGKARNSDAVMMIRDSTEIADPKSRPQKKRLTWKFECTQTRDVAWASSASYIWDAARVNLPGGKTILAQSVYPGKSATADGWLRSTEIVKAAVEHYSQKWYSYPYPVVTNAAGIVYGMEYPSISFCAVWLQKADTWRVIDHEIAHNWFPMTVGSNERENAWMDEGLTSFISTLSRKAFNHGEFAMSDTNRLILAKNIYGDSLNAVANRADVGFEALSYDKPSFGLTLLREEVLGEQRFDKAFRDYIHTWAFKHPMPNDFFRFMENSTGERLDWFWRGWFIKNWRIDLAILRVVPSVDTSQCSLLFQSYEKLPMPVTVEVTLKNGRKDRFRLPVEFWQQRPQNNYLYKVPADEIDQIVVDPDKRLPDINPSNNIWKRK